MGRGISCDGTEVIVDSKLLLISDVLQILYSDLVDLWMAAC
jgi:hypothetical protein